MSFIKDLVKASGNEYANIVAEGVAAGDVDSFVDTGSYIFNALLSGSLYGGLVNKITPSVSSTQNILCIRKCKQFLEDNPNSAVVFRV